MPHSYFFQEITCIPDTDIGIGFLMGRVMNALHLALVNASAGLSQCTIGMSFPDYRQLAASGDPASAGPPIGAKVRLFARQPGELDTAEVAECLGRFSDYVDVRSPAELKRTNLKFARFSRHQPRTSLTRQIRRQMKRKGWTQEQAERHFQGYRDTMCRLPYLDLRSHTTERRFRLFVRKESAEESESWQFSTYGLSARSSVPDW